MWLSDADIERAIERERATMNNAGDYETILWARDAIAKLEARDPQYLAGVAAALDSDY